VPGLPDGIPVFRASSPGLSQGKCTGDRHIARLPRETAAFTKEFGVTFPIALDDTKRYPASNAYGLSNVPTLFLISPEGRIEVTSVGWSQDELEDVSDRLAAAAGIDKKEIVHASDDVPSFKPG